MWPFFIRQQEHHSRLLSKESDKTKFLFQRARPSSSEQNKVKTIAKALHLLPNMCHLSALLQEARKRVCFVHCCISLGTQGLTLHLVCGRASQILTEFIHCYWNGCGKYFPMYLTLNATICDTILTYLYPGHFNIPNTCLTLQYIIRVQ